jgi:FkbM family methyltransferase
MDEQPSTLPDQVSKEPSDPDNTLIQLDGFTLRQSDKHFRQLGDTIATYQSGIRETAYDYVQNWAAAIDIGGHIGIFSRDFSSRFVKVHTFEPMPRNRFLLEKNVPGNVTIYPYGLGDRAGFSRMKYTVKNSGGSEVTDPTQVLPEAPSEPADPDERVIYAEIRTLDSFNLDQIGLIKIDVQGMEPFVLRGAAATIRRSMPVLIIEEKAVKTRNNDRTAIEEATELILSYGYRKATMVKNDAIYVPDSF